MTSSSSSARPRKRKETRGGPRPGSGRKPLTRERAIELAVERVAGESLLLRDRGIAFLEETELSPRRRLLLGERVKERTEGPWLARVLAKTCVQQIGRFAGQPLKLEPFEQRFVNDATTFDDAGRYIYSTSVLGVPRKNGKTTLAGGVSVVKASPADGEGKPIVIHAAGSREQAGPLNDTTYDFIMGSPLLSSIFAAYKTDISCPVNGGRITRVAGDGKMNHGLNPYFVVADELFAWLTPRQKENWNALTTADGARDDALFWVITTAGWDLASVLGELYRRALSSPAMRRDRKMGDGGFVVRDESLRLLVHWYGIGPETRLDDVAAFKRANPASWRSRARIEEDLRKATLDEGTKRRLYGNQWTSASEAWIPGDRWRELEDARAVREGFEGAPRAVGVDASLSHDTTAIGEALELEDGRIAVRSTVWSVRREAPAHRYVAGKQIPLGEVEQAVRELETTGGVTAIGYDPRYFNRSAQALDEEGFVVVNYEPQARSTWDAIQGFYNLVAAGGIVHDGDPVLAAHLDATAGTKTDRGWKLSKLRMTAPIDAVIAVILAVDLVVSGASAQPWVGWGEDDEEAEE